MKVLFVCAELYPFLKTGGLADVTAGRPPALLSLGCDVRYLMPAFPALVHAALARKRLSALPDHPVPWGHAPRFPKADVFLTHLSGLEAPVYLIESPVLYQRPGSPYVNAQGQDWRDNALRFAALGWAGANLGLKLDPHWVPDVIHCHDWHTGLTPAYVRAFIEAGHPMPATVFTIHNLSYQGLFPEDTFDSLGLPSKQFAMDGLEFFGHVSYMKAALMYADRITTVSPTYASEIRHAPEGCGLDGVLRARADVVSGVLNGVDYKVWNPAHDRWLPKAYDADHLEGKAIAKKKLQLNFGLEARANALVLGVVSRLTEQKGLHLLPDVISELVERGGQLALLGQGDAGLEQAFAHAAVQYPGQIGVRIGYDEATAHKVIAGADVLAVPSAFEPCGLTQLYGLCYGTLPLVRRVGGLADTVLDCTMENLDEGVATGFVFEGLSAQELLAALRRAFVLFSRPSQWKAVQRRGMGLRFDWQTAAQHYQSIYQSLRPAA